MPSEQVNRETVVRRKERLLDEYENVHRQEITDELAGFLDHCRSEYTGGGYAWVVRDPDQAAELTESMPDEVDDGRRALMILGRGESRWGSPAAAARTAKRTRKRPSGRSARRPTSSAN